MLQRRWEGLWCECVVCVVNDPNILPHPTHPIPASASYTEVVSPNMFNLDLWRISGHYDHYLENMFTFEVENQGFGLKVRGS